MIVKLNQILIQKRAVMQFEKKTRDKSVDKLKKALTINLLSTPFFVGGPTWTRTRDQLIMSQLLAAKALTGKALLTKEL